MYPRYRSGFSPFGRHQPHSANGRHTTNSRYEPRSVSPNDQNNAASPPPRTSMHAAAAS